MNIYILTGPAGVGKNTIASEFAKQKTKCVVIDVDLVRWMVVQPHKAPWEGEEGHEQQILGVKNTCLLIKSFINEGYDVIVTDWLSNETANLYKDLLKSHNPQIILLLPTFQEIQNRNKKRPPRISDKEIKMTYDKQVELKVYDKKIDNTKLSPIEAVNIILD